MFQYQFEFYMIVHCSCLQGYAHHLDWKESLLKQVSDLKKCDRYDVKRGNPLKDLIKNRKIDFLLNKPMKEILYIYEDMTTKCYAFERKTPFNEYMANLVYYNDNYKAAKKRINDDESGLFEDKWDKDCCISELNILYRENNDYFNELSDIQKISLTKLLTKDFLKTQL